MKEQIHAKSLEQDFFLFFWAGGVAYIPSVLQYMCTGWRGEKQEEIRKRKKHREENNAKIH